ncbi:MAG TPA: DinB family protein [Terriglobales bacterium]|nr:DinB family protein [Terriglobales bacterium]
MAFSEALLPEFDQEVVGIRKTLERVPEEKLGWKPHEKSMTMGGLATHLANVLTWAVITVDNDSFDLAPGGVPMAPVPQVKSRKELLETFDQNVVAARKAIAGAADAHLLKPWALLHNGKQVVSMPRIAVLRSFVMNHAIHHRAQLGVYLRLNNLPVPSIYGPSADEGTM